ncbi:GntR family transcriptional regulator [Zhihengliuella halotolerans]|uniref:GntR family transcriptional regulator n=1 Tax=Zhihengliuella halotolerans TaxID=370736 RepID=A0A4Q8ABH9_9MICC|nr:GntR family transcriptional regulator [Zhihengliuella halotolerans]RZU61520.1 GntR family transcriptional regulator [Zhihengliuella halotolerans]
MDNLEFLAIDAASETHPYDQIRRQIIDAVGQGRLVAGERLVPVRKLAEQLGVAVNTVARAYKELEAAGVVVTKGRAGTVVQAAPGSANAQVSKAAEEYARVVSAWGVPDDEALDLVRAALEKSHS